jgi:hypothetical protein
MAKMTLGEIRCFCGSPMKYRIKEDGGYDFPPLLVCQREGCDGRHLRKARQKKTPRISTGVPIDKLVAKVGGSDVDA